MIMLLLITRQLDSHYIAITLIRIGFATEQSFMSL